MTYERTWTVYAGDTDYSGRIYTPAVVDYVIKTLTELRSGVGFGNERIETGPVVPPARNVDIDFLGAIRVGDELTMRLTPSIGTTSVTHAFTGTVDDELVCEGEFTVVWIDKETGQPVTVPEELVPELERVAESEPR